GLQRRRAPQRGSSLREHAGRDLLHPQHEQAVRARSHAWIAGALALGACAHDAALPGDEVVDLSAVVDRGAPPLAPVDLASPADLSPRPPDLAPHLSHGIGFSQEIVSKTGNAYPSQIVAGDFDGDGNPDVIAACNLGLMFFAGLGNGKLAT